MQALLAHSGQAVEPHLPSSEQKNRRERLTLIPSDPVSKLSSDQERASLEGAMVIQIMLTHRHIRSGIPVTLYRRADLFNAQLSFVRSQAPPEDRC